MDGGAEVEVCRNFEHLRGIEEILCPGADL
jgi:hypothetical protein